TRLIRTCYLSYFSHAVINLLPSLLFALFTRHYGLSFEQLGRLVFINFGTRFVVDILGIVLADRLGYRKCLVAAHGFAALGLLMLGGLPQRLAVDHVYTGLMLTMVVFAAGGGLIQVLVNPIVNEVAGQLDESALILLHSTYPWGCVMTIVVTTVALHVTPEQLWFLIPFAWMAMPLFTLYRFATTPMVEPRMRETPGISLRQLMRTPGFWTTALLMPFVGMTEAGIGQWSSVFIEKALGFPKIVGDLIGPSVASLIKAIIRMTHPRWSQKIPREKLLLVGSFGTMLCFVGAALLPHPVLGLLAITCTGFTIAMLWPGVLQRTAQRFPDGGTALFGSLSLGGDMGCAVGPWIIGAVAGPDPEDITRLRAGMLTGALFPLAYFIILRVDQRREKKRLNAGQPA
ncbi:MAG: MFS transporter, partial [Oscillospiraceae bacterium]|nr:MFS transporter [Oscillospiraceae bacterium]